MTTTTGPRPVAWTEVVFDDVIPPGIEPYESWNAMGMDPHGRVYVGFTSALPDGRDDVAIVRYDPDTGERAFLGTLMQAAAAAGNLAPGESIPKGHTRMVLHGGRLYMGSQSFHDLKDSTDDLQAMRGAHLFACDVASGSLVDVSARLPGGVVIEHQGIVSLDILPERPLLVGLAHPFSDVVLYDCVANRVVDVLAGIPWRSDNPVSRELIVSRSGRIYTYRGTERLAQRDERHSVHVHDLASRRRWETPFACTEGFWVGKTVSRGGNKTYVSTTHGRLYEFDTVTEAFTDLGHLLPPGEYAAGRRTDHLYALTLSPDERWVYCIPAQTSNPAGSGELIAFDLAAGTPVFVQQLPPGVYTSGDVRDASRVYFACFGTESEPWHGRTRLVILEMPRE